MPGNVDALPITHDLILRNLRIVSPQPDAFLIGADVVAGDVVVDAEDFYAIFTVGDGIPDDDVPIVSAKDAGAPFHDVKIHDGDVAGRDVDSDASPVALKVMVGAVEDYVILLDDDGALNCTRESVNVSGALDGSGRRLHAAISLNVNGACGFGL